MLLMTVTIYRDCHAVNPGVSPRRAATTLSLTGGLDEYADLLADLGRHTTGKGCLYVKRLADVDLAVLRKILARSVSLATKA